jgi:DNA (cytosine-5)-methyltransferase 1
MARLRAVSLFSGAGGLDYGLVQSGLFDIIFANDIMESAAETYSVNFRLELERCNGKARAHRGAVLACNVEEVDFSPLVDVNPDVVVGGPPCQDFSVVRGPDWDRRGIEVRRGKLYSHFVRALAVLQPKAFLFENVPGLRSANKGFAYEIIRKDFEELNVRWDQVRKTIECDGARPSEGYVILFDKIIDFSRFGVPQKRERLIIVGVRKDLVRTSDRLWEAQSAFEEALKKSEGLLGRYPLTPIETFEGRRLDELEAEYREVLRKWEGVWDCVRTERARRWKAEVWDRLTFSPVEDYLRSIGVRPFDKGEVEEALNQHERVLKELDYREKPVSALRPPDGTNEMPKEDPEVLERLRHIPFGENHEFVRGTRWEVEGKGISLVYRRLHPLKPSYTIVAYGGGGTHSYHYDRGRGQLTLREKARLQTFPDSFLFMGNRTEVRAQIGEAVPPLAGKRLAEALSAALAALE